MNSNDLNQKSLEQHAAWRGKLRTVPKMAVDSKDALSIAYTPGVAAPCLEIAADERLAYTYTGKGNTVAVITNGTAVLGLGDIGGLASMPVMEGKCVLFQAFGGIDAVPICVDTRDVDEFVRTVALIAQSFGGINLEDISAPRCFEIERRLKEICPIPVFHDDQHGTAIVVAAAMTNALKLKGCALSELRMVFSGAGAAGVAIFKLLRQMGMKNAILFDKDGAVYAGRSDLAENPVLAEIAAQSNEAGFCGTMAEALVGADGFIGVSAPNLVTTEMVASMNPDPVIFALANPVAEIHPDDARRAGARLVGTGRSDFPNQINNVLAFPGVFRGALDAGASSITEAMKVAAAQALAGLVGDKLAPDFLLPEAFDSRVVPTVAAAVANAAKEESL